MKLALAAVEKAVDFRDVMEDIKDAEKDAYLADKAKVELVMSIEEEETIGPVDKIIDW